MHAIRIDRQGQPQVIVNDQARTKLMAQTAQATGGIHAYGRIASLVTVLYERCTAAQRRLNAREQDLRRKTVRCNGVEATQNVPFRLRHRRPR